MGPFTIYLRINRTTLENIDEKLKNKYFEPVLKRSPSFVVEKDPLEGYVLKYPVHLDEERMLQSKFGCFGPFIIHFLDEKKVKKIIHSKMKKHFQRNQLEYLYFDLLSTNDTDTLTDSSIDTILANDITESSGIDSDLEED